MANPKSQTSSRFPIDGALHLLRDFDLKEVFEVVAFDAVGRAKDKSHLRFDKVLFLAKDPAPLLFEDAAVVRSQESIEKLQCSTTCCGLRCLRNQENTMSSSVENVLPYRNDGAVSFAAKYNQRNSEGCVAYVSRVAIPHFLLDGT